MIKQDKKSSWSIKIGSGIKPSNIKLYPKDRLEKFLNFEPKSEKELGDFCTKYQIIPLALSLKENNLFEAFKKEQLLMRGIAQKIAKRLELSKKDWDLINVNLGKIRRSITLLSSVKIDKINQVRSGQIEPLPIGDYPEETFTHGNTTSSLWQALYNSMSCGLCTCIGCGSYFKPVSKHHREYCTQICANKTRQEKYRAKKASM